MMQPTVNRTPEEDFKDSIDDAIVIAKGLTNHCQTVEELIGLLSHALENPAQLRLLFHIVVEKKK